MDKVSCRASVFAYCEKEIPARLAIGTRLGRLSPGLVTLHLGGLIRVLDASIS